MRKVYVCMMIAVAFLGLSVQSVEAASEREMVQFLERYCDDISPVDDCGRYDNDMQEAQLKARNFDRKLQNYAAAKRNVVIYHMVGEFNEIFETTGSIDEKLVAAYYYTYFSNEADTTAYNVSSIISELFNRSANNARYEDTYDYTYTYADTRYKNAYENEGGELTSVHGRSSRTSVSGNDIEIDTDIIDLVIRAEDDRGRDITSSSEYRVVAKFDKNEDRTYAATNSGNEWRLRLSQDSSRNDELHIYLLCRSCNTGTRFSSRSVLDGWRVLDVESYDVDGRYSSYSSYSSYNRYDEDSDLSLNRLEYTYDINRNDTEIRVTTTVRNEGDDDVILDDLAYNIEVDGDQLSYRDIDIDHVRTYCDESSSRGERNIRVEEDDECEIIVDITLDIDDDDIENEIVEIQVALDADDDDNSRNDEKTIRFRAD